jgi:hypothetical protein
VMCRRMMLGEIVGEIVGAFSPMYYEVTLFDAVTYPIKTHDNGFGPLMFDGLIGYTCRTCIICFNGCGQLFMAHFHKGGAEWDTVSLALWKSAPSSASMADAMTLRMMELMILVAPF